MSSTEDPLYLSSGLFNIVFLVSLQMRLAHSKLRIMKLMAVEKITARVSLMHRVAMHPGFGHCFLMLSQ